MEEIRTVMIILGMLPCSAMTAKRDKVSSFPTTSLKSVGRYFSNHGNSTVALDEEAAIRTKGEVEMKSGTGSRWEPFWETKFPSLELISLCGSCQSEAGQ